MNPVAALEPNVLRSASASAPESQASPASPVSLVSPRRRRLLAALAGTAGTSLAAPLFAATQASTAVKAGTPAAAASPVAPAVAPSATAPAAGPDYRLARQDVARLPDIALLTMHKRATTLARELDTDQPLWLNFVFTTCSTTCSMQTAVLAALQTRLQREQRPARFLSLTIDPDSDTPEQLNAFATRFGVQPASWQFCTGRFEDLLQPQRAFDVYRGSKASHPPVVLLRTARQAPWWRITGFPTPEDLHGVLVDKLRRT